jgi:hypothetical protein
MKIKMVALSLFISGAGTKLLQSQMGNSKEIMTLPSYPLLYFYPHWETWVKKYKKLSITQIYGLIIKHHESIIDSKKIIGFNGLTNLGKAKNKSIKISKNKFKRFFFEYLKNKSINSKNTLLGIHYAFHKSRGKNFSKIKYILYHVHNFEYFKRYLIKDFPNTKLILITRNPLQNFWRRAYTNIQIEKKRYDYSDQEYLKNFTYLNLLDQIFIDVDHIDKNLTNKTSNKIIKFEDLKTSNLYTVKNIYNFLKIKFKKRDLIPRFLGLEWWSHKNYKGYSSKKIFVPKLNLDPEDEKKFFFYEKIVLEILFYSFYKKFKYKSSINKFLLFIFPLIILLPTKYGINLFFSRLKINNLYMYIKKSYIECFDLKMKNYYFNAMYKHKYLYRNKFIINQNLLRKIVYDLKKKKIVYFFSFLLFINKIISFIYIQLELIILYFVRIFKIIKYFFKINVLKKKIIKKIKLN